VKQAGFMNETAARRIAIFIDFENLVTNTGITPSSFDLQPSLDRLLEKGKVIFRRAYCDWSRFKDAKQHLHEFGVELIDVPPSTRSGKNSADMRLVIDALELCYAREHIDTFVIASGDSDFVPLASKLRENDKYVIGIGVKMSTSPVFVKACDEFIYLKGEAHPRRGRDEKHGDEHKHAEKKHDKPKAAAEKQEKRKAEIPVIAREVVASLLQRATGPLNPSFIKETIVRKEPDFDEREHGFSTFSRLLEAMEKEGLCLRIQQGRQWYVVSKEGAPKEATAKDGGAREEPDEETIPDPEE
jgi:uncharacterized protein (TIGR00288 family)